MKAPRAQAPAPPTNDESRITNHESTDAQHSIKAPQPDVAAAEDQVPSGRSLDDLNLSCRFKKRLTNYLGLIFVHPRRGTMIRQPWHPPPPTHSEHSMAETE
ncbi:hypothetical protein C0995_000795 [Termitomyces sp. Mi166|nr:hypothetical protein C0995_000795 [Termitomyces sp. Mi166\